MKEAVRKKSRGFATGAAMLAAAGMLAKLIGAVYRIPLTNILGAEGMGMYQLVFPIYALLLTLSSSGVSTAIARLISEGRAINEERSAARIAKASLILLTVGGGTAFFLLLVLSRPLALLQGNSAISLGYYAIAPSIIIVACSAYFKGWFQGNMNMTPSAVAQIAEQAAKLVFGLIFARFLLKYGLIYAVVGALLGVTLSEIIGLATLAFMYISERDNSVKVKLEAGGVKKVFNISLPIMIGSVILPVSQFIDSILIVKALTVWGHTSQQATEQYGLLSGAVNSLVNMPVVITLALAVAIVPVVAGAKGEKNCAKIKSRASVAVKLAYFVGVPCFIGVFLLSPEITRLLYPSLSEYNARLAGRLFRVASLQIVAMSGLQIYTALLQGVGKSVAPIRNLSIACIVKIPVSILLIRFIGIMGACLANLIAYITANALNSLYFRKLLGKNAKLFKSISKILTIGVIMFIVLLPCVYFIRNSVVRLACSVILGVIVYIALTAVFRVFEYEEVKAMPLISAFADKLYRRKE